MMRRFPLSWSIPVCLCVCLAASAAPAQGQQKLQSITDIAPVPGLKVATPILLPTLQKRGEGELLPGAASPFSGKAPAASHDPLRFPADLANHGGPTLDSATQHALFVNPSASCPANSCWGDPIGFLTDLSDSRFIGVTNQYVNSYGRDRYPMGASYVLPGYAPSAGAGMPFTNEDMAIAAYSVAAETGGFGYGHVYHLFLVPGQDVCNNSTFSTCYSPDNPKTFSFCAYHASAQDQSGNVVLYTVQPYEDVPGCNVAPGTPNGQVVDSNDNVLSHETIETITDPLGNAWWNSGDVAVYGQEIADECEFVSVTANAAYFDPNVVRLNHKVYAVQPEYSNQLHACTTIPSF